MSAHSQPRLAPEEYLAIERAAQFRSEYYNARMYVMPGEDPEGISSLTITSPSQSILQREIALA
jgi:hypothetical protein